MQKGTPTLKADEWSHIRAVLPNALWLAFRDDDDTVSTGYDPITSKRPDVYRAVTNFTASIRVLTSRTISCTQADEAQETLAEVCRTLIQCGMALSINWHIALHFSLFIALYGPVGTYSTWAYERNNGRLASVRYFKGGTLQMTTTAARRWLKEQLLFAVLHNPAPNATEEERAYYDELRKRLSKEGVLGTLLAETQHSRAGRRRIDMPRPSRTFDLKRSEPDERLYTATLGYLQQALPDAHLVGDYEVWSPNPMLPAGGHHQFAHVRITGFR